jgi:cytochrome P450
MANPRQELPSASARDTVALLLDVVLPVLAKGPIIRRPFFVRLSERLDLDGRALRRMQRIRARYKPGPLLVKLPLRRQSLLLSPEHVHRVLEGADEPFAPSTTEKRATLPHFEPRVSLASHGAKRQDRRRFNEDVLDTERPLHRHAEAFHRVIREEADELLERTGREGGELDWDGFELSWFRIVRRIVLGDGARDDQELTEVLESLRSDANVGLVMPRRRGLKAKFDRLLAIHLERAEPGSLAGVIAGTHTTAVTAPADQVPQYLFAYDPAGMTTFRTLALLATHPEQAQRARAEIRDAGTNGSPSELPFLRACVLDSLRLWPTTPFLLRETTAETSWEAGVMPKGTGILIFAPFFHRDDRRLPWAHRFAPEIWLDQRAADQWPLIPFSGGPGICPGQNLVLLTATTMLASILGKRTVRMQDARRLDPSRPMPAILDNYSLRFDLTASSGDSLAVPGQPSRVTVRENQETRPR